MVHIGPLLMVMPSIRTFLQLTVWMKLGRRAASSVPKTRSLTGVPATAISYRRLAAASCFFFQGHQALPWPSSLPPPVTATSVQSRA
jgi:hypothetical protein